MNHTRIGEIRAEQSSLVSKTGDLEQLDSLENVVRRIG